MRYYINSIVSYIDSQLQVNTQEKTLQIIIPRLEDGRVAVKLGNCLESLCFDKGIQLEYKVAGEQCIRWSAELQSTLQRLDYCASGSLTRLRNELADRSEDILQILVGADYVTDKASLADFHRCDDQTLWEIGLNRSFNRWIKLFFKQYNLECDDKELVHYESILEELHIRFGLLRISNWLEDTTIEAGAANEAFAQLLKNPTAFALPNLSGFINDNKKSLSFRQCLDEAESFFSYSRFLDASSRKKTLSNIEGFKNSLNEFEMFRVFPFTTQEDFFSALTNYIGKHDISSIDALRQCDFTYVRENILKFKQKKETPQKETSHKLSGSPLEIVLQALWASFGFFKEIPRKISLNGISFHHDYLCDDDSNSLDAKNSLKRLLGGLDDLLKDQMLLKDAEESDIEFQSVLLNETTCYISVKNGEPHFEFQVLLENDNKKECYRFTWKLPFIHPYRLANDLLLKAYEALSQCSKPCLLPVFHFAYYDELFDAVDDEEGCRLLQHCITECQPGTETFMENLFTEVWEKEAPNQKAFVPYVEKLSESYQAFIRTAVEKGLPAALCTKALLRSKGDEVVLAYTAAGNAYITDASCSKCHKLAIMLMRSFLITEQHKNIVSWAVREYEPNAIISILHPSIIEMQHAKMLFLLAAFNYLANQEIRTKRKFRQRQWMSYEDMSAIQMPLPGLLTNPDGKLSINIHGRGLLHRIGEISSKMTSMSTRLLTRYDVIDDDELNSTLFSKETRESELLLRILNEYRVMHPHVQDGISLAIFRNDDLQPILAALDKFLQREWEDGDISPKSGRKYFVKLMIFTESTDDTGIYNLLRQWRDYWDTNEEEDRMSYYSYCQVSVSHRIISSEQNHKEFSRILEREIDTDIIVFYNFVETVNGNNKFRRAMQFDATQDTLKFPILEKTFCANLEPDEKLKRSQIISNRQFRINATYTELLARIQHSTIPINQWHVILGHGDFEPWQSVIESAHRCAEWVVCVDANIDEQLIASRTEGNHDKKRELIGFGSGVGVHGESNYTISTQKFAFADLRIGLQNGLKTVFCNYGTPEDDTLITNSLLEDAAKISGLSLIRALGPTYYKCDFIAYNMMRKILPITEESHLCDRIFSIDAYRHWFDMGSEDKTHPDLLWLRADLNENGEMAIEVRLIECKMAQKNDEHIAKAVEQIKNGLDVLVKAFSPKVEGVEIPDQRYWCVQLHRLIASCAMVDSEREATFLTAMENLIAGRFTIRWSAGIFAFWTDIQQSDIKKVDLLDITTADDKTFKVPVYTMGYGFIRNICGGQKTPLSSWDDCGITIEPSMNTNRPEIARRQPEPQPMASEDPVLPTVVIPPLPNPPVVEPLPVKLETIVTAHDVPQRIFLGHANHGTRKVYWEFGNKELNNRHLLIFGSSGSGKTYAIQAILCELGLQQQHSLIVDYTNGFVPKQLNAVTTSVLSPKQHLVKKEKLPLSPFCKYSKDLGIGLTIEDTPLDVAKRITSIFDSVYGLGEQQTSILIDAIEEGMKNGTMTLNTLKMVLEKYLNDSVHIGSSVKTILSKLKPFISEQPFSYDSLLGWNDIFNSVETKCHIFQLAGEDEKTSRILTEVILWDLYSFCTSYSTERTPKVVVLDEIQNLDHRLESPLGKILTEGRKFGLAIIAATQTLSNLKKEEQARLFQAGHKLFFRPSDPELNSYVEIIAQMAKQSQDKSYWKQTLSNLKKGECISIGPAFCEQNDNTKNEIVKIKIEALDERGF